MSRSYKHINIIGICGVKPGTRKRFKQAENKKYRRKCSMITTQCDIDVLYPDLKQYGNPWDDPYDGRQFCINSKYLRK